MPNSSSRYTVCREKIILMSNCLCFFFHFFFPKLLPYIAFKRAWGTQKYIKSVFISLGCLLPEDAGMLPLLKQHFSLMGSLLQTSLWLCFSVLQTPCQVVSPVHAGQNSVDSDENQKPLCFPLICAPSAENKQGRRWASWEREEGYKTVGGELLEMPTSAHLKFSPGFSMILREIKLSRTLARLLRRDSKDQIEVTRKTCWWPQRCCKTNSRACYCYYSNIIQFL